MTRDGKPIADALRAAMGQLPSDARVHHLDWSWYEDTGGNEAVLVEVRLDGSLSDEDLRSVPAHEIKDVVRTALRAHDVEHFPYFQFVREGEDAPRTATG